MDLISTIGESAALGAAGVILWGDAGYTTSTVSKRPHPAYQSGVCRGQAESWGFQLLTLKVDEPSLPPKAFLVPVEKTEFLPYVPFWVHLCPHFPSQQE